ncbi:MAG: glycine cleavage system protein R [Desulfohalobiaceae bacterium]
MRSKYIMTVTGQDRPGIVADVTQALFELGCNLEDSSMTRLWDEFALILLFSCPSQDQESYLKQAFARLEQEKGLWTSFRPLESKPPKIPKVRQNKHVYISCLEQCGVLYRVSTHLYRQGINIIRLVSSRDFSSASGHMLYNIDLEIELPPNLGSQELDLEMQRLQQELGAEIRLGE